MINCGWNADFARYKAESDKKYHAHKYLQCLPFHLPSNIHICAHGILIRTNSIKQTSDKDPYFISRSTLRFGAGDFKGRVGAGQALAGKVASNYLPFWQIPVD